MLVSAWLTLTTRLRCASSSAVLSVHWLDRVIHYERDPLLRRHLRRCPHGLRVSISSRPAEADVRRQWGMEDFVGLEIELGDVVEYPLAGPE